MVVANDEFRRALGRFGSGVTVVTARVDGRDHGMTASSFCSVSLDPPLVLVCVQRSVRMHEVLLRARGFAVNLLSDGQLAMSDRFAGRSPEPQDRFDGLDVERAPDSGAPYLAGSLAHLDCGLRAAHDAGDHSVFVGEVRGIKASAESEPHRPLMYYAGRYWTLGDAL